MPSKFYQLQGELRPILSQYARGYKNPAHVGQGLAPIAHVDDIESKVPTFSDEEFLEWETKRAPGGDSNTMELDDAEFTDIKLQEYDLEARIDYLHKKSAQKFYDVERRAQMKTTKAVALSVEKAIATELQDTSKYAVGNKSELTGENQWSDYTHSDPIIAVRNAVNTVSGQIGIEPRDMLLAKEVFQTLQDHPVILERIKYSEKGIIDLAFLKQIFDMDNIYVAKAFSRRKGDKTKTKYPIWNNCCIIGYVPKNRSNIATNNLEPSFAQTFRLKDSDLGVMPIVFTYKPGNGKVTFCNTTDVVKPMIVGSTAGYIFTKCVGS